MFMNRNNFDDDEDDPPPRLPPPLSRNKPGDLFDDSSIIKDITQVAITRIIVHHGLFINSLTMHYTNSHSTPVTHGGTLGTRTEIILRPGEFITAIDGVVADSCIAKLKFETNKGVIFGPYGRGQGTTQQPFVWGAADKVPTNLAPRMGLLYFSGRACDTYIRELRPTFTLYPTRTKPSRNVKFEKRMSPEPAACGVAQSSFSRNIMSPVVAIHVGPDAVVFHAYEATLCRIPFFRAALQGEFREASEKKITMPEEKPEIFSALIEYLYTGSYTYTYGADPIDVPDVLEYFTPPDDDVSPAPDLAEGCFHVSVYAVAFAYDWAPLMSDALHNFLSVLPQLAGMDIVRLWKAAYENGLTLPMCADGGRLAEFEKALPMLLKGLYQTDREEMVSTVSEFPALASDFMCLLVSGSEGLV